MTLKEDMPPDREASKPLQDWAKDIEDLVNSYDPEQEVIVALWLSDDAGKGGMYNFRLSQQPYPPEVYKLRREHLK